MVVFNAGILQKHLNDVKYLIDSKDRFEFLKYVKIIIENNIIGFKTIGWNHNYIKSEYQAFISEDDVFYLPYNETSSYLNGIDQKDDICIENIIDRGVWVSTRVSSDIKNTTFFAPKFEDFPSTFINDGGHIKKIIRGKDGDTEIDAIELFTLNIPSNILYVLGDLVLTAPKDDVRQYLNGMCVSINSMVTGSTNKYNVDFVTTDGHRMSNVSFMSDIVKNNIDIDNENNENDLLKTQIIIPTNMLEYIVKILDSNKKEVFEGNLSYYSNDTFKCTLVSARKKIVVGGDVVDGKYPDYESVVMRVNSPNVNHIFSTDNQKVLLNTLLGIKKTIKGGKDGFVIFEFTKNNIKLSYKAIVDVGEIKQQSIELNFPTLLESADYIKVAYNIRYIIESLSIKSKSQYKSLSFYINSISNMCLVTKYDGLVETIIMPVRI